MIRVIFILLLIPNLTFSQDYFKNHFGGTAGIVLRFGTHTNAIGLSLRGFYTESFFQVNLTSTVTFYEKGIGERKRFWESRSAIGGILLGGKRQMNPDFQIDGLNHQTPYNLGIGYNYIVYLDNIGTSQLSGAFAAHIKNVSLYFENDVFAGQAKDRFRTGHLFISYRKDNFKAGLGLNMWTGETSGANWQHIKQEETPNGFKILEDLPYGRTSHGILYGSVNYNLLYGQDLFFKAGIDSEHIRHAFQNKLIHDGKILPFKNRKKTPHYPRLDENGCPVFEKSDVRKNKFFLQFGMNGEWSN